MAKTNKEEEFNPNPPLSISNKKFIVLRNKEQGNIFWTSGGEYRSDWYDLILETDDFDEARGYYTKHYYDKIMK